MCVCMRAIQSRVLGSSYVMLDQEETATEARKHCYSSFFTLFQVAFSLPIAFSTSLEGSVIEMKPATLAPQDTAVSLKA